MLNFYKDKRLFFIINILIIVFFTSCNINSSNPIPDTEKSSKERIYSKVESNTLKVESNTLEGNMEISSGSYSGISFGTAEYALNKSNGEYVIFWVKNTGKVNVKIIINNYSKELIIEPDKEGYITEEFSKDEQNFAFKAVPTPNGGNISIEYKIRQNNINK